MKLLFKNRLVYRFIKGAYKSLVMEALILILKNIEPKQILFGRSNFTK
jgi:hypothetical protein